jgi:hypothetical protein
MAFCPYNRQKRPGAKKALAGKKGGAEAFTPKESIWENPLAQITL